MSNESYYDFGGGLVVDLRSLDREEELQSPEEVEESLRNWIQAEKEREIREAGPPLNPYEACYYDKDQLYRGAIEAHVDDPVLVEKIFEQIERKTPLLLEAARRGGTLRQQVESRAATAGVSVFEPIPVEEIHGTPGPSTRFPSAVQFREEIERLLPVVEELMGHGRGRDQGLVASRFTRLFPELTRERALYIASMNPARATRELVAFGHGCSERHMRRILDGEVGPPSSKGTRRKV